MQPQGSLVRVWFERVDGGSAIVMEYERTCPSCGASWARPGSVRLGGSTVGVQFFCWSCETNHPELREPDARWK